MQTVKTEIIHGQKHLQGLSGKWELIYTPVGTAGPEGFGGRGLGPYKHPLTNKKIHRRVAGEDGKVYRQFMIAKLKTTFTPATNAQHLIDVEWLIHHPEVALEGYENLSEAWVSKKNKASNMKLVAVDFQEVFTVDEEDEIDIVVGRILGQGKNQLGIEKIRIILSTLGVTYRDPRYTDNLQIEKKILRQKMKTYAKSSVKHARLMKDALNNIENNRDDYYIKEMARLKVLIHSNGFYKHKGQPVAATPEGVKQAWIDDPNLKEIHMKALDLETTSETNPKAESFL